MPSNTQMHRRWPFKTNMHSPLNPAPAHVPSGRLSLCTRRPSPWIFWTGTLFHLTCWVWSFFQRRLELKKKTKNCLMLESSQLIQSGLCLMSVFGFSCWNLSGITNESSCVIVSDTVRSLPSWCLIRTAESYMRRSVLITIGSGTDLLP